MSSATRLNAPMLFAQSQGSGCVGSFFCHWCCSPCGSDFLHDDPPPVPFLRSKSTAKCPLEPYICTGCWLWRRQRVTVTFLTGGYQDRQEAKNHSWWITDKTAVALSSKEDHQQLYRVLIQNPQRFVLALKVPTETVDTLLQLAVVNNLDGVIADTPLHFTLNNIPHQFSQYELTEAIRNGPNAYGPGVRALWKFLGEPPHDVKKRFPINKENEKKERGRPEPIKDAKYTSKKVVVHSGEQVAA